MATGPQSRGAARVLVVEDEPAVRAMLTMILEAENYAVETAEDGEEAVGKAQHQKPAVILLDMMLPRMDGSEVIQALRAHPNTRDVRIITMSGAYELLRATEHLVQGHVLKPFDLDVLLTILEEVLREPAPMFV